MLKDVFSKDKQKQKSFHAFAGSEASSSEGDDKNTGQQKRRKAADDFQDSELSDDQHYRMTELLDNVEGRNGDAFLTSPGDQEELGKEEDPEAKAREDYNRKLMDFRRDELVLNEESDGDDDCDSVDSECNKAPKDKNIQGVEDAYDLVERYEHRFWEARDCFSLYDPDGKGRISGGVVAEALARFGARPDGAGDDDWAAEVAIAMHECGCDANGTVNFNSFKNVWNHTKGLAEKDSRGAPESPIPRNRRIRRGDRQFIWLAWKTKMLLELGALTPKQTEE